MRILTRPNLGGPTRQAIALWHAHAATGLRTLLVTGAVGRDEPALSPAQAGIPELSLARALELGADAVGTVVVPQLGRGLAPWSDLRAGALLRRLVAAFAPDVVHTHTSKAGWLGRRAAAKARVPVVAHTFHGHVLADYFPVAASKVLARLEARLARRTDLLFAVSDSCADELAAAGIAARERFVVVPPAVATGPAVPRAEARRRLGIAEDRFAVACIGRLVPIKRVAHFVELFRARPEWCGDVVGDGPLRGELLAAAAARAPGQVTLRGAVPDIAALLPAYDALVLPSVREGCPLVAVEAFAAGVPVVGYDVPGVHDALGSWGSGLLVPPRDGPAGLAAALLRLQAEPGLAASLAAAGRASLGRFAPAAVAARLAAAYREALAAAPR